MQASKPSNRPKVLRVGQPAEPCLGFDGQPLRRIMLGATWDDVDFDIDMCAVLVDDYGQIPSQQCFVYRRNRWAPERSAFVTWKMPGEEAGIDRAQVLVDLDRLDESVVAVKIALTAVMRGQPLGNAGTVRTRVMDLTTAHTPFVFSPPAAVYAHERCMELWKIERAHGGWVVEALGEAYPGGPSAFARDHGYRPG